MLVDGVCDDAPDRRRAAERRRVCSDRIGGTQRLAVRRSGRVKEDVLPGVLEGGVEVVHARGLRLSRGAPDGQTMRLASRVCRSGAMYIDPSRT